jgi:predicted transglutaminase-like cysteine proteinase
MKMKFIVFGGASFAVLVVATIIASDHFAMTAMEHLTPGEPALAPMGDVLFCLHNPDDCKKTSGDRKNVAKPVALTPDRRTQLDQVNAGVNQSIIPQAEPETAGFGVWVINPVAGDCNDYAVTKRHDLLAKGWPPETLLLTEVALQSGEHHLVLIARTNEGDLVLDNLHPTVRTVAEADLDYKWVRMESSDDPKFWNKIRKSTSRQRGRMA